MHYADLWLPMCQRVGEGIYKVNTFHSGVHPQASVGPHQCPSVLYRRYIDHSHAAIFIYISGNFLLLPAILMCFIVQEI